MCPISYRRHRFPPAVIQDAVCLYLRFTLTEEHERLPEELENFKSLAEAEA